MDTNTLIIILLVVLLLGGGGFFFRGRRQSLHFPFGSSDGSGTLHRVVAIDQFDPETWRFGVDHEGIGVARRSKASRRDCS